MITYEKLTNQFDLYKAFYRRIDSYYWSHMKYDQSWNVLLTPEERADLKQLYFEYKVENASLLSMVNEYSKGLFSLQKDNIPLIRRDIADLDNRLQRILKGII